MSGFLSRVKRLDPVATTIFVGTGLLCVAVIILAIFAGNQFTDSCTAKGGHVRTVTQTGNTVSPKGEVGIATTSTSFCLSDDGRILDIG